MIEKVYDSGIYKRTKMQKEMIIRKLKDKGGRMTRQRFMLLDIILKNEYSSCKEIYYKAISKNEKISLSTVYRMINALEEIGAISRNNMYKIVCGETHETADAYIIEFDDGTAARLSAKEWYQVIRTGLRECGYMQNKELCSVEAVTRQ